MKISVLGARAIGPMLGGLLQHDAPDLEVVLIARGEHGRVLGKLALNALGYTSCLSASNFITEALANCPWREAVGLPLVDECRRVFEHARIELARIPGVPSLPRLERFIQFIFLLPQDLQRRKATEVDYTNGEIVRLAATVNIRAPMNAEVVRMVHELEERRDARSLPETKPCAASDNCRRRLSVRRSGFVVANLFSSAPSTGGQATRGIR
jgi:ketopantoate reductase